MKAVTYYKAAIKTSGQNSFRFDLAELLWRLKRYKESQNIITSALEISESQSINSYDCDSGLIEFDLKRKHIELIGQDLENLEWEVKLINLLAQVQLHTDSKDTAIATLKRAHASNQK